MSVSEPSSSPAFRVLLARHGDAVPEGPMRPDEFRFLSQRGRDKVRGVGQVLAAQGVRIDAVLTSPLARAVQTAELIAHAAGFQREIQTDVGLLPSSFPQVMAETIRERAGQLTTLMVVGHMPSISALGGQLVGLPGFPPLKPGHVFAIDDGQPAFKIDPDRLEVEQFLLS